MTVKNVWNQWNMQQQRREFCKLNNLYLKVERGMKITITIVNDMYSLLKLAYDEDDPMITWWEEQFEKLPGWYDV